MAGATADRDRLSLWFRQELPRLLPSWLPQQRWFGAKARVIHEVAVQDILWLPAAPRPVAVVVTDVSYAPADSGSSDRCALVLGLAEGGADGAIGRGPGPDDGDVTEQAATGDAIWALLAGMIGAPPVTGVSGGVLVYADTAPRARQLLSSEAPPLVRPAGVEQSNTSVRVGTTHMFKLFRRLEAGEHPQLEVGRFLAQAGFLAVPQLEGSLVYRAADGQESALGALEGWVANQGDGWSHVLARLDACRGDGHGRADLYAELVSLGETTAGFHAALASDTSLDAFSPEAAGAADAACWEHDVEAQAERASALLEDRLGTLTPEHAALATAVLVTRQGLVRPAPALDATTGFDRIRIHGDFHLGQTLKTDGGFVLIDFEGEPSKPLAARRQKQCALRDVAGMLRSLDYAVATSDLAAGAAAAASAPLDAMRQAFLEGYYAQADRRGARFLPSPAPIRDAWTSLFELEKAWYEVEYQLNNRPTWVHIPLRALARLLEATP